MGLTGPVKSAASLLAGVAALVPVPLASLYLLAIFPSVPFAWLPAIILGVALGSVVAGAIAGENGVKHGVGVALVPIAFQVLILGALISSGEVRGGPFIEWIYFLLVLAACFTITLLAGAGGGWLGERLRKRKSE